MVKNKNLKNKTHDHQNNTNNLYNICKSKNIKHSKSDDKERNKKREPKYNRLNHIVAVFAVVMAGVAAYFSFRQSEIIENTAQRQLKAYLSTEITGWQGLDGKYLFATAIRIVNYGQTPAKIVRRS